MNKYSSITLFLFSLILLQEGICLSKNRVSSAKFLKKSHCDDNASCFPPIPSNLQNVNVQIQTYIAFDGQRPCLKYDGNLGHFMAPCDSQDLSQKWIIKSSGKPSLFLISPASKQIVYLNVPAQPSPDADLTLTNVKQDQYLEWYVATLGRGGLPFYTLVNAKKNAGLYYNTQGKPLARSYAGGWWQDHFLVNIAPEIQTGFAVKYLGKYINLRAGMNKLCLEINPANLKVWTRRCGSENKNQHFMISTTGGLVYTISVEGYPFKSLTANSNTDDVYLAALQPFDLSSQTWTIRHDESTPVNYYFINLKTQRVLTISNEYEGYSKSYNMANTKTQWLHVPENLGPSKTLDSCRNECQSHAGGRKIFSCGNAACCPVLSYKDCERASMAFSDLKAMIGQSSGDVCKTTVNLEQCENFNYAPSYWN